MAAVGSAELLLKGIPSQAGWYAEPMLRETAEALHKDALRVQRTALIHANSSFMPMLCALAASFWIESYDESEWLQLSQLASSEYEKALIELLQGQLLMSRKLAGAHQRLNSAFMQASNHLDAAGYFEVLKRLEQLACLPTSPQASEPLGLDALLTEAAVIQRMGGCTAEVPKRESIDTIG